MSAIGRRVARWFRQLFRREKAWTPVERRNLMYDPAFVSASFRSGERVDPLTPSVEE